MNATSAWERGQTELGADILDQHEKGALVRPLLDRAKRMVADLAAPVDNIWLGVQSLRHMIEGILVLKESTLLSGVLSRTHHRIAFQLAKENPPIFVAKNQGVGLDRGPCLLGEGPHAAALDMHAIELSEIRQEAARPVDANTIRMTISAKLSASARTSSDTRSRSGTRPHSSHRYTTGVVDGA